MARKTNGLTKTEKKKIVLVESAWEVANKIGGIHTVLKSKIDHQLKNWGKNYVLLGPYIEEAARGDFEELRLNNSPVCRAVEAMQKKGYSIKYGNWLVSGRPATVLLDYLSVDPKILTKYYFELTKMGIFINKSDDLQNQVLAFGFLQMEFFRFLDQICTGDFKIIAHFHEWMASASLGLINKKFKSVHTMFTTHATLLGRYLAMRDEDFYKKLESYDWAEESKIFGIFGPVSIERAAAQKCDILSTVSGITAKECKYLLQRPVDALLPNGLNVERFEALHEFQVLHLQFKRRIKEFVMGHFFHSYSFDLDKTLFFFTSGRFEYRNKGFDLTLDALNRLNQKIKTSGMDVTVVNFFVTKQPCQSLNPEALQSRAGMQEIREICKDMVSGVGERLFEAVASQDSWKMPDLNLLIKEHLDLKLRKAFSEWKSQGIPLVITHNLVDDGPDPILNYIRKKGFYNKKEDPVKMVYHPDFITPMSPLFKMDYSQFVRGCHLGIFPSYYEPWGYTPLECMVRGIPSVTSDYSGFGEYVSNHVKDPAKKGIFLLRRSKQEYEVSVEALADILFQFVKLSRRERISLRNQTEAHAAMFDWSKLNCFYEEAYKKVLYPDAVG